MVRLLTSLPSAPLGPSPSGCPTAGSSPVGRASACGRGEPTPPGTAGFAIPAQVRSGIAPRRSLEWNRYLPDPLLPPLCWTLPVARPLAEYPVDRPYRTEV